MKKLSLLCVIVSVIFLVGCPPIDNFTRDTYSVTYFGNMADSGYVPVDNGDYFDAEYVTVKGNVNNLQRNGYEFVGWSTVGNAPLEYVEGDTIVVNGEDIALFAVWNVSSFSVTYDSLGENAGYCPEEQFVSHNETVVISDNVGDLHKEGYYFAGWSTTPGTVVEFFPGDEIIVSDDITLYAVWVEVSNPKVTFYLEDGSGDTLERFVYYPDDRLLELPPSPVREGYSFENWYTLPNGSGEVFSTETQITDDLIVYANWSINSYTLNFNSNDADSGSVPQNITLSYDSSIYLPGNIGNLNRIGYTFSGWSTAIDGAAEFIEGDQYTIGSSDITLYAVWTLNSYTVTYSNSGADSGSAPSSITAEYNTVINISDNTGNMIKSGYHFIGWSTTLNGDMEYGVNYPLIIGTEDITLYPVWSEAEVFTVMFYIDADNIDYRYVTYPETVVSSLPEDPVKEGYTFLGWFNSVTDEEFLTDTVVTESLQVNAIWEINSYTVTYHNSGSDAGTVIEPVTYDFGEALVIDNNSGSLEKTGYTFTGWSPSYDWSLVYSGGQVITMGTENIDFYPMWEVASYTITYFADDADSGFIPPSSTYNWGSYITIESNLGYFSRDGYDFIGWSTTPDGSVEYSGGEMIPIGEADLNLYAVWEINSFSVTYNIDDADAGTVPSSVNVDYGSLIEIDNNTGSLEKTGYTFSGWAISSGGSLSYLGGQEITVESAMDLYPVWEINSYSITYRRGDATAGTVPSSINIDYGTLVEIDNNSGSLIRPGYTFIGWATSSGGSLSYVGGQEITVVSNMYLYPVWSINSYSITYHYDDADGGSVPTSQNVSYGSQIVVDDNSGALEKTGYSFDGWSITSGGSLNYIGGQPLNVYSDIDLYPVWGTNNYYLLYDGNDATGGSVPFQVTGNIGTEVIVANSGFLYKDGHTFMGWSLTDTGSVNYTSGSTFTFGGSNTILYAVWSINDYTVTYHSDGSDSGSEPEYMTVNYNTSVSVADNSGNLYRTGYTFSGWSSTLNGSLEYESGSTLVVDGDVDLYPVWSINSYTVTFNGSSEDSGYAPADINSDYNTYITIPGNTGSLVREGYSFVGWSTTVNGSVEYYAGDNLIIGLSNIELFAVWELNNYTVNYFDTDADSGSAPSVMSAVYGETVTLDTNSGELTREGFTLSGWGTASDGAVLYLLGESITMGSSDLNLYPIWSVNSYTLTYHSSDAETGNAPSAVSVNYGHNITIDSNSGILARDGYTLTGWSNTYNGAVDYLLGESMTMGSSDLDLYPVWSINSYTLTYHSTGADTGYAPASVEADFNSSLTISSNSGSLTREGHSFIGWSTTYNGSLEYSAGDSIIMGSESIDLYPVWDIHEFLITYHNTGAEYGVIPVPQLVEYNSSVFASGNSGNLRKTGYSFDGWSTTENGILEYNEYSTISAVVSDLDLYPVWSINSYTVSFNGNNYTSGSVPSSITDNYNEVITIPGVGSLARDNHTFKGWSTTNSGDIEYVEGDTITLSDTDISLHAVWYKNQIISANISIPTGDTITISDPLEVTKGDSLTISVEESFSSYSWYLDGTLIVGESSQTITLDTTSMDAKQYELMVVTINVNGVYSSANYRIRVNN